MDWSSLLLIYDSIDVRLGHQSNNPRHFAHVLPENEVQDGIRSYEQFPALVESLASGRARVLYEIHRIQRPLTSLTLIDNGMYWPSPTDTQPEIDRLAALGTCDSIFVLWPQRNLREGRSIRSAGWGLALAASAWSNDATYATVSNTESWRWQVPMLGEVWLHEWLHGVCVHYARLGYVMPDGDADGGARHGYIQSPVSGWTDFYRDLMTCNVLEGGRPTGIPLDAW
jgi:hypothetical protein